LSGQGGASLQWIEIMAKRTAKFWHPSILCPRHVVKGLCVKKWPA
jgi:hypothetical protein